MFKAVGNIFQGVNSIAEGARKKRDARKLIKMAEARARNAEQQDFVNQSAMIKVGSRASERALENINLGATQAFEQASDAGIRGIGMMGKILQNVNDATAQETARQEEKEFQVQQLKAQEAQQEEAERQRIFENEQARTDAMMERGQALRSQGSAEIGQGASLAGGGIDAGIQAGLGFAKAGGFKNLGKALSVATKGGGPDSTRKFVNPINAPVAGVQTPTQTPSLANRPFSPQQGGINLGNSLGMLATASRFLRQ